MRLIAVEKLPENNDTWNEKKNMKAFLEEFINMNVKYALIDFNTSDYNNFDCARAALASAIRRHVSPIKLHTRGDQLYFERTDM